MCALALRDSFNSFGNNQFNSQTKTLPINRNTRFLEEKGGYYTFHNLNNTKESFICYPTKKTESLIDTSSNNIYITYSNFPFIIEAKPHDKCALDIKNQLDCQIKQQNEDDVLLFLFNSLEDNLMERNYDVCNSFLRIINIYDYNEIILIGILTATLPWKKHLLSRQSFFYSVKDKIDSIFPQDEAIQLLCGLE